MAFWFVIWLSQQAEAFEATTLLITEEEGETWSHT
jgi:hypothetical protein